MIRRYGLCVALFASCTPAPTTNAPDTGVDDETDPAPTGFTPQSGEWVLTDVAQEIGLLELDRRNRGGAVADFDGDGRLDLYTANPGDTAGLYLRKTAAFTARTGPTTGWNTAAVPVDYDADGDTDLYVSCGGFATTCSNRLFRNDGVTADGDVTFTDVTESSGIGLRPASSFGGSWADYDGDGDLDVFAPAKDIIDIVKDPDMARHWEENEQPAFDPTAPTTPRLHRNNGDGTFTDVTEEANLDLPGHYHTSVWIDVNEDGHMDLFLPGFNKANRLMENQGDGSFFDVSTAELRDIGLTFAAAAQDVNNDGHVDLVVAAHHDVRGPRDEGDAYYVGNRIFLSDGTGKLTDVADAAGLHDRSSGRGYHGVMGFRLGDLDQDGWMEMVFGNGSPSAPQENAMYSFSVRSDGSLRVVDRSSLIRLRPPHDGGVAYPYRTHGIFFFDFDEDGDQDLFLGNGGMTSRQREPNRVFRNDSTYRHGYVDVSLKGTRSNLSGVGALIQVSDAPLDEATWAHSWYVARGNGFNVGKAGPNRIGTGLHEGRVVVTVRWPDQTVDEVRDVALTDHITVTQSE